MTVLEKALEYAANGLAIFPAHGIVDGLCTCGNHSCSSQGKHPAINGGFKNATTDLETIRGWWAQHPSANVAIATGALSGLFVLDVDVGDTKEGDTSLEALEAEIGPLPRDAVVRTGSGGLHIYLQMPDANVRSSASKLGKNLDVRADGGYVIAPPSAHISGNNYEWMNDSV